MSGKIREYETRVFDRINPAVKFSVTRYVLTIGIFVAVVVFGFICVFGLGVDLFPAVNVPVVNIATTWTGASPSVVDQQVTQVLENVVSGLAGITDISSTSQLGSSRVRLSFDQTVDKNSAANQVAALVSAAVKKLPSGAATPVVQTFDPNSSPIVQFGISAEGTSIGEVNDYVQNTLIPELERVDGVANITTNGGPSRQFRVLLNPDRMRLYKLSPTQVVQAIAGSAINQSIGTIVSSNSSLTFSTQNVPEGEAQVAAILVDAAHGIKVADVASVRDSEVASDYARVDGKPVVLVSIQRTSDSNSVAVARSVKKLLRTARIPEGYTIEFSNDTTGPITASINSTYRELFMTALVVALIVLLFLGKLNTAFAVILAIPIALSASPILYKVAGFTFNLVSLLALVTAIGIVVDDSIVVAENVERYKLMGFGPVESVMKGASEVFSAVVAASLSLLSVLIPVSFIGGFAGRYLTQFSLGLAAAVFFSFLEAVLFLTVRLAYTKDSRPLGWDDFLERLSGFPSSVRWGRAAWRKPAGIVVALAAATVLVVTKTWAGFIALPFYPVILGVLHYVGGLLMSLLEALTTTCHTITESGIGWIRDRYVASVGKTLRHSTAVLVLSVVFIAVSGVFIFSRLSFNFIPQSDNGAMNVNLRLPPGTPIDVTNAAAGKVESFLLAQPEVSMVQTVVGSSGAYAGGAVQPQNATMTVQLAPVGKRANVYKLVPAFRTALLALFRNQPGVRIGVSASGTGGPGSQSNTFSVSLVSPSLDALTSGDAAVVNALQKDRWVVDVNSDLANKTLENDFVPDAARFTGTGLTPSSVSTGLQIYASGTQAANVVTGGLSYPIQVAVDPTYLSGGQSLLNLPVYSPTLQANMQVGQLGSFTLAEAPVQIGRYNRMYSCSYAMNLRPDAPSALEMQKDVTDELARAGLLANGIQVSAGSSMSMAALSQQLAQTGPAIFLIALFLCYLVMAAQFNSWRYPVYLLLPVPFALVGALWVLFLKGASLDVFGIMGMVMLIGLSAKNAILYLDFVVERVGKMPLADALIEAASLRFRPIVMTTLTVLVISFPLVFGGGQGAEFGQGLGIVMLGGIVVSALMTFFVVPAAFYAFERRRAVKVAAGPGACVR